jgi:hypothetical protein
VKFLIEVVYDERDKCLAMRIVFACGGYANFVVSSVFLRDMLFRRKKNVKEEKSFLKCKRKKIMKKITRRKINFSSYKTHFFPSSLWTSPTFKHHKLS